MEGQNRASGHNAGRGRLTTIPSTLDRRSDDRPPRTRRKRRWERRWRLLTEVRLSDPRDETAVLVFGRAAIAQLDDLFRAGRASHPYVACPVAVTFLAFHLRFPSGSWGRRPLHSRSMLYWAKGGRIASDYTNPFYASQCCDSSVSGSVCSRTLSIPWRRREATACCEMPSSTPSSSIVTFRGVS